MKIVIRINEKRSFSNDLKENSKDERFSNERDQEMVIMHSFGEERPSQRNNAKRDAG